MRDQKRRRTVMLQTELLVLVFAAARASMIAMCSPSASPTIPFADAAVKDAARRFAVPPLIDSVGILDSRFAAGQSLIWPKAGVSFHLKRSGARHAPAPEDSGPPAVR